MAFDPYARIELIFPPHPARYLRFIQITSQESNPWIINELFVFETDGIRMDQNAEEINSLIAFIEKREIKVVYTDPSTGARIAIGSNGRIQVAGTSRLADWYNQLIPTPSLSWSVDFSANPAFILERSMATMFESSLGAGWRYQMADIGGYRVFYSIKPPTFPLYAMPVEEWHGKAVGPALPSLALDRNVRTAWLTPSDPNAETTYFLTSDRIHRVNGIALLLTEPRNPYQRRVRIKASIDGRSWQEIIPRYSRSYYWNGFSLLLDRKGIAPNLPPDNEVDTEITFRKVELLFDPVEAQQLLLTFFGAWSISEIFLFEEGGREGPLPPSFTKSIKALRHGEMFRSLKDLIVTFKSAPNMVDAYSALAFLLDRYPDAYDRAVIFEEAGQWEEAAKEYKYIVDNLKDNSIKSIYVHLRNCYVRLGDKVRSKEMDDRILREFSPSIPTNINYGDKILFLGYDINKNQVRRGEVFHITYYWEGLKRVDKDYKIFVHFKSKDSIFQHDHKPLEGRYYKGSYKTNEWPEEEKVKEDYEISVPENLAPGTYKITIGVWDPKSGKRLIVKGERKDEVEVGAIEIL